MMMMMLMRINFFCGMVDQRKTFRLICSWDHCQRSSPSRISNMPQAGFEPVQSLSSGLAEWSCAVLITTTPQCISFEFFYFIKNHKISLSYEWFSVLNDILLPKLVISSWNGHVVFFLWEVPSNKTSGM